MFFNLEICLRVFFYVSVSVDAAYHPPPPQSNSCPPHISMWPSGWKKQMDQAWPKKTSKKTSKKTNVNRSPKFVLPTISICYDLTKSRLLQKSCSLLSEIWRTSGPRAPFEMPPDFIVFLSCDRLSPSLASSEVSRLKGNWKELVSPSHLKNNYSTSHYETDNAMKYQEASANVKKKWMTIGQVVLEQQSKNLSRQGAPMTPAKSSPASTAWAQWQTSSAVSPEWTRRHRQHIPSRL